MDKNKDKQDYTSAQTTDNKTQPDTITADITYAQALAQLEQIVADLQDQNTDIDTMAIKTRHAATLLKICRAKLTATEDQIKDILAQMQ